MTTSHYIFARNMNVEGVAYSAGARIKEGDISDGCFRSMVRLHQLLAATPEQELGIAKQQADLDEAQAKDAVDAKPKSTRKNSAKTRLTRKSSVGE